MRLAWSTDVHLNHADPAAYKAFLHRIHATGADVLVITGDISEGHSFSRYLTTLRDDARMPVFFVLGNHDFYGSSIAAGRAAASQCHRPAQGLVWLTAAGVHELTPEVALVGHDGWADGRYADWFKSSVDLNDYHLIPELHRGRPLALRREGHHWVPSEPGPMWATVLQRMRALADESAAHALAHVRDALARYPRVIFATHCPPFRENAVYAGQVSDDNWMPHFSNKALGDALRACAAAHPDRELLVLCGHSHGSADHQPRPNLRALTGHARYRFPDVAKAFDLARPLLTIE